MNFDLALECQENKEVMRIASQKFKIPKEDKNQCKMLGLWDAVSLFDSSHGVPFKLFLSLRVKFRCLKYYNENYDQKINYINENVIYKRINKGQDSGNNYFHKIDDNAVKKSKNTTFYDDILMSLEGRDKDLIISRFIENRTLKDIGSQYNVSHETIRKWINVILEKVKV